MDSRSAGSRSRLAAAALFAGTFLVRASFALVNKGFVTGDVAQIQVWGRLILGYDVKYPSNYPPFWYYVSALLVLVGERTGITYDLLLKLFPALADAGIAALLFLAVSRRRGSTGAGLAAALFWMLNPVSIIITSFHGQIDSVCLFLCLWALLLLEEAPRRFLVVGALLLGTAIGIKAWPVLFLPVFALLLPVSLGRRALFCVLAAFPTAVTLLPYLVATPGATFTAVLGYSGVTDHGWVAACRAGWFLKSGNEWLPGDMADVLLARGKLVFVPSYFVLLGFLKWRRRDAGTAILCIVLLFFTVYGGLSSQYLVWPLPFALLLFNPMSVPYTLAATCSLVSFYLRHFAEILVGGWHVALPAPAVAARWHLISTSVWWGLVCLWLVGQLVARRRERAGVPGAYSAEGG